MRHGSSVGAKCIVGKLFEQAALLVWVSRFRCPVDIIGMTHSEKGWRKLNLSWGVTPVLCKKYDSIEAMFADDLKQAKEVFPLKEGDNVVLTGGLLDGSSGTTNMIKVERIDG